MSGTAQTRGPVELAPGRCVTAHMPMSDCMACVLACPHDALDTAGAGLALDPARCTGCGQCTAACPQGALSLAPALPSPIRARAGQVALIACARAAHAPAHAAPCAQALGLGDLARLWLDGVRVLALATGDCGTCPEAPPAGRDGLAERIDLLAALLATRGHAPLPARIAPPALIRRLALPQDHADDTARRAALGLPRHSAADTAAGLGPAGALRRLQDLPPAAGQAALFAAAPRIAPARCTGCDACARICPEGALILVKDSNGAMHYDTDAPACTGCGLCQEICDEDAVDVQRPAGTVSSVTLFPYTCRSCRAQMHHPSSDFAAEGLCPACRRSARHRQPVLVLE